MGKSTALVIVGTETALLLMAGLVGIAASMFVPMMFDAPEASEHLATRALAVTVVTFPLTCLVSILLGWAFWLAHRYVTACLMPVLSLVHLIVFVAVVVWLNEAQGGKF
jgi:hypothetical protein